MSKGRVLVTGADGFTGRYMVDALNEAGYEVHGVIRRAADDLPAGLVAVHMADLSDRSTLSEVVTQVQPDKVIHLAAISFVADGDVDAIYATNLLGTQHLVEALCALRHTPSTVLLASSANVYGNATSGVLDETAVPVPANDYSVSKLAMEYMARLHRDQLPIVISRPFNYTGVGQAESFLLPKIVAHVRRAAPVIELGNLDVARDFSDVRMVVHAYLRLLQTPTAIGGTFNICAGKAYTLAEVLSLVREISGRSFDVRVNPAFVRSNEVRTLLGSRARLEACIGPLPDIELRDTLRWMLTA